MNKTKKIAAVAVSLVLAGTMVSSLAACGGGAKPDKRTIVRTSIGYGGNDETGISFATTTLPLKQANGKDASSNIKLPDGTTYRKGALKPIFKAYENALNIRISDNWTKEEDNLAACVQKGLSSYNLIGAGKSATIQQQVDAGTLLDLSQYWDKLPNLKYFLDNNALAEIGTIGDTVTGATYYSPYYGGMNDVERPNLFRRDYVAEFLDYADLTDANLISRYGGTISFAAQAATKKNAERGARTKDKETYDGTKASIEAYMGTTDSYVVKTTNPGDPLHTVWVKVDYAAANAAAKDDQTPLGAAVKAAAGDVAYTGTSGNIVDLQNHAINSTSGAVKGEHLLKILREYIKVAYKWDAEENGSFANTFYGTEVNGKQTKLSDIINSAWATWDVDIYAAIGRVYVTCGNILGEYQAQGGTSNHTQNGGTTWLFTPRTAFTNRTTRLTAMIGELYGVRGFEGGGYLDTSGHLRDYRFNAASWDALTKFSAFHTEGLVPSFDSTKGGDDFTEPNSSCNSHYLDDTHYQGLSGNDFVAGQTKNAEFEVTFKKGEGPNKKGTVETTDGYDWTCVTAPVSKWLTNDTSTVNDGGVITKAFNGTLDERDPDNCTIMRFTESNLKLKDGGLVIPKATADNEEVLNATLALLDYIYSPDGLIETTFGTRSDTDNLKGSDEKGYTTTNNGWWYGEEVTSVAGTDISGKSMEELVTMGIVETHDGGKQYTMTKEYQGYALVYKNKLYRTGTNSSQNGGVLDTYDDGYKYGGAMTPYYTTAVRKLCQGNIVVNGFKSTEAIGDVNLKNKFLGQESFGIVHNASATQLYSDMATPGVDVVSTTLGNGSLQSVKQSIDTDNLWYTCAPSVSPSGSAKEEIDKYTDFTALFATGGKIANYFILEVGWYGEDVNFSNWKLSETTSDLTPKGISAYMSKLAPQFENLRNAVWATTLNWYLSKNSSSN